MRTTWTAEARERCRAEWARVERLPSLPGTPGLDRERAELLARAKGEPVIFARPPEHRPSTNRAVRGYRRALTQSPFPWELLGRVQDRFRFAPRIGRQVLLRDGYLYAERAELAWSLWNSVKLEHLFDEPVIWLERATTRHRLVRDPSRGYLHSDGPDRGQPARLLLFDRAWVDGEEPGPPLHRDLRTLAHELGFERSEIVRITTDRILAKLRYGAIWVPTVLQSSGARVSSVCEIEPEGAVELAAVRATARQRAGVQAELQKAMLAMVADELPFDEPRRELGQQDGHLRGHWLRAYLRGEPNFEFNGDRYAVFASDGRPLPPQVCIDFVTETLERASGTWWRTRGAEPGRNLGGLDFDALLAQSRRQVTTFINHTEQHPEQFEHELIAEHKRIPYADKRAFYRHLAQSADLYRPGTIVIIEGLAPWDRLSVPHSHAFFVYEADPVTGMPLLLAGNNGRPRIQSWEPVMNRAPRRSINYRIRPRLSWLLEAIPEAGSAAPGAPPLAAMF